MGRIPGSGSGVAVRASLGGSRQVVQARFSGFSGFELRGAAKPGTLGAEFVGELAGPVSGFALARGLDSYCGMQQ